MLRLVLSFVTSKNLKAPSMPTGKHVDFIENNIVFAGPI